MVKQLHVNECDSTQDILKEQIAAAPSAEVILVSCEHQKKGRGRGENQWKAMPGTLCFSLNVKPSLVLSFTALEISLLIVKFFENKGAKLSLKWPNDIWDAEGKKCGGILIQTHQQNYLAGIGLNLFSEDDEFGAMFSTPFALEKEALACEIAEFIVNHRYPDIERLKNDWESRCGHMRKGVTISENGDVDPGVFEGLGAHGEALLTTEQGLKRLYNGSLRLT
jgi:BirA family biotin operon repressor/biotin-[acetyl-CoA-carboxylase] ligase